MTEALKKWVRDKASKSEVLTTSFVDDDEFHAEFWVRAFCDEVEKRAKSSDPAEQVLGYLFKLVKRELLGA